MLLLLISLIGVIGGTPLDDYVNAPDPHYGYTLLDKYYMPGYSLYILNFTSQKWYDGKSMFDY